MRADAGPERFIRPALVSGTTARRTPQVPRRALHGGLVGCCDEAAAVGRWVIDKLPLVVVFHLAEYANGFVFAGAGHAYNRSTAEYLIVAALLVKTGQLLDRLPESALIAGSSWGLVGVIGATARIGVRSSSPSRWVAAESTATIAAERSTTIAAESTATIAAECATTIATESATTITAKGAAAIAAEGATWAAT